MMINRGIPSSWIRTLVCSLLMPWIMLSVSSGQDGNSTSPTSIFAGDLEFRFATPHQGRAILGSEDAYIQSQGPFDRKVRLRMESDPGKKAFLEFVSEQVIQWPERDRAAVRKALEELDQPLSGLRLPDVGPVMLVCTTGREESGAAYTRGPAIVLPKGKARSVDKPPVRLIAHELFHVLSRSDPAWRDRLYSIVGFRGINEIQLPQSVAPRRITNPDAPEITHAMKVQVDDDTTAFVTPVLLAKSDFDPKIPSLFSYIDLKLLEVSKDDDDRWGPRTVNDQPILHEPSLPDFHRQIGANTGYIIHPDEILADNFVILVTGAEAKDQWLIDSLRAELGR